MKTQNYIKMLNKLFAFILAGLMLLFGCGEPTDPEIIEPDDETTGGYKIVKEFQIPGYAQDVVKQGNYLYLAQGEGGLLIIDIGNPVEPQIVSSTSENVRGYSTKIEIVDSVVYLAAGTFGVSVLNVVNPETPQVKATNLGIKPARNLHIMEKYLLTAISEQGVNVSNINNPEFPDIRGGVQTPGYAYGLTTHDTTLLLIATGEMGLTTYNISDFQDGYGQYPLVDWCDTPGYAEAITINETESIAFMACGTAGLQVIDYSDTTNVHIVGSFDNGGYAKELIYKDNKIFMTAELSGLQVIDVSDYTQPYLIGELDTEFALGIDMDDQYIYIADEDQGLIVIKQATQ